MNIDNLPNLAWVRESRSGKFLVSRFGHRDPLAEERWRHTSVTAPARGTVWSRRASCRRARAAPFRHEASRADFGLAAPFAQEQWRHFLGTRLPTPKA